MKTLDFHGLKIRVEHPKGSVRSGVGEDGQPWKRAMLADYGEFASSRLAPDGDKVDVYVGEDRESDVVVVAHLLRANGDYDEDKVIVGYDSVESALRLFRLTYPEGCYGGHTVMNVDQLRRYIRRSGLLKSINGWAATRDRARLVKSSIQPPPGFTPIPGSKTGGHHRFHNGEWEYWYPPKGADHHAKPKIPQVMAPAHTAAENARQEWHAQKKTHPDAEVVDGVVRYADEDRHHSWVALPTGQIVDPTRHAVPENAVYIAHKPVSAIELSKPRTKVVKEGQPAAGPTPEAGVYIPSAIMAPKVNITAPPAPKAPTAPEEPVYGLNDGKGFSANVYAVGEGYGVSAVYTLPSGAVKYVHPETGAQDKYQAFDSLAAAKDYAEKVFAAEMQENAFDPSPPVSNAPSLGSAVPEAKPEPPQALKTWVNDKTKVSRPGAVVEHHGVEMTVIGTTHNGGLIVKGPTGDSVIPPNVTPKLKKEAPYASPTEALKAKHPDRVIALPKNLDAPMTKVLGFKNLPPGTNFYTSPAKPVSAVIEHIQAKGHDVYVVGGAARSIVESMAGALPDDQFVKSIKDADLVTTLPVTQFAAVFDATLQPPCFTPNEKLGVASNLGLDMAGMAVKNVYNNQATTVFGGDLETDAQRRDFTCNSLYYDPANKVVLDPTGLGVQDVKNRILRKPPGDEWYSNTGKAHASLSFRYWKLRFRGWKGDGGETQAFCVSKSEEKLGSVPPSRLMKDLGKLFKGQPKEAAYQKIRDVMYEDGAGAFFEKRIAPHKAELFANIWEK